MSKPTPMKSLAAGLGISLAVAWGSAAFAQQQFDDETLNSFAVAAVQVQQIGEAAQQELQMADGPEQQQQVHMQAQQRMLEAVEAEGLSIEEYNAIASAAQEDAALAEEIDRHFNQAAQ